jgi:hypothetical protein
MKVTKMGTARNLLAENREITAKELAKKMSIGEQYAYNLLWKLKQPTKKKARKPSKAVLMQNLSDVSWKITQGRGRPRMQTVGVFTSDRPLRMIDTNAKDNVNNPAHYKVGGIETIDFIEAKKLSYNLGNVVKYVTRAEHKGNTKEDLQKAQWYLNRELKNLAK